MVICKNSGGRQDNGGHRNSVCQDSGLRRQGYCQILVELLIRSTTNVESFSFFFLNELGGKEPWRKKKKKLEKKMKKGVTSFSGLV